MVETPDASVRHVLLADADAFYVSVARLVDPEGIGREPLLIVGGTADGRGVVTSASYEAREFGVRSAMPTAQALRLCPGAVVVPVPRDVCVEKSRAILRVLRQFTPVVEPASIDEFYLDLTGTDRLYRGRTLTDIAKRVLQRTELAVSIGGGTSKLVAKVAAKYAKPQPGRGRTGVHIVEPGRELDFMRRLPLSDIPMIGPKFQERLAGYGLVTVEDLLRQDEKTLTEWFGKRAGPWLLRRAHGIDEARVATGYQRKSLGHEETFPRDLETDDELNRELLHLTVRVAADLRAKSLRARTVTVKLRDADFTTRQAARTLPRPVNTDRPLLTVARQLLTKLRADRQMAARLIGIALSHLSPEDDAEQLSLFGDGDDARLETPRDHALAKVFDDIESKYGRRGIVRGSEVPGRQRWRWDGRGGSVDRFPQ
jgi:DNA polymerase-4